MPIHTADIQGARCVCDMCSCGKHHCPTHGDPFANDGQFHGDTEYGNMYYEKGGERSQPFRPGDNRQAAGPFEGATTHEADYKPWQVNKEQSFRPSQTYNPSGSPFDEDTTNKADYTPKAADRTVGFKPASTRHTGDSPFDGDTTHTRDYTPKEGGRGQSYRPNEAALRSDQPIDGITTNAADYTPKEAGRDKPIRPRSTKIRSGPFQGETEHNAAFTEKEPGKQQSFRPANNPYASNAPFDGNTVYAGDFVPKRGNRCLAEIVITGRDKSYALVGDKGNHRWYKKMGGINSGRSTPQSMRRD